MTPRNGQRQLQPSVKNRGHSGLRKSKDCEEVMMKDSLGRVSARPLSPECGRKESNDDSNYYSFNIFSVFDWLKARA